jgi:hypothetical protein
VSEAERLILRVLIVEDTPERQEREILPAAVAFPVSRMVRSNAAFQLLRQRLDAGEFPFGPVEG